MGSTSERKERRRKSGNSWEVRKGQRIVRKIREANVKGKETEENI